jgi:hypothetical protein
MGPEKSGVVREPDSSGGVVCIALVGIANIALQSSVLLGKAPVTSLTIFSAVVFVSIIILLLLGFRSASFSIYAIALLTSYSDVSWGGSAFKEQSSAVADMRLGPLSVAMWYLLLLSTMIFVRRDMWMPPKEQLHFAVLREMRPLTVIAFIGILGGVARVCFAGNSLEDLATDVFALLFVFLFLYGVLGCLSKTRIENLLRTALVLAIVSVILNAGLGVRVNYGGQFFVPIPDIVNYLPIVILAVLGRSRRLCICSWILYVSAAFGAGLIAPTGKLILVVMMSAVYLTMIDKNSIPSGRRLIPIAAAIFGIIFFSGGIADMLDFFDYQVLAYKYRQVFAVAALARDTPILFYSSSIGNLSAEIETVWRSLTTGEVFLGRGFGAWYRDLTGHLSMADAMAYSDQIIGSGHFRRFHLPIIEVMSWAGAIGVIAYCLMVRKLWRRIRNGTYSALLPLTILLFTLGFLKENQLMFSLGLAYGMNGMGYRSGNSDATLGQGPDT